MRKYFDSDKMTNLSKQQIGFFILLLYINCLSLLFPVPLTFWRITTTNVFTEISG